MWFNSFSTRREEHELVLTENGRPVDKGKGYVFNDDLAAAIDVAIGLGRPLLVAGEPGCGKTELGYAIARRMGIERLHFFSVKSTAEARDLLYSYDAIGRFRDAQIAKFGAEGSRSRDQSNAGDYIEFEALGRAILDAHAPERVAHLLGGRRGYVHPGKAQRSVVVIDEIDKAPRDFPNDLLREIEDLSFRVAELSRDRLRGEGGGADAADWQPETPEGGSIDPACRPVVIITSNEERQLPDAFLRRCVFHEIEFPRPEILRQIVASGLRKGRRAPPPGDRLTLADGDRDRLIELLLKFREARPEKMPGVSELIDAAHLVAYPVEETSPPALGERLAMTMAALAKMKSDRKLFEEVRAALAPGAG